MIALQSEHVLSPKPQKSSSSRAASPVPSAVLPSGESSPTTLINTSSPQLPLPVNNLRRSSFSTEFPTGNTKEGYVTKPLLNQRSLPQLNKSSNLGVKERRKLSNSNRRGSDSTTVDDTGSDGGLSTATTAQVAVEPIKFANDKRNNDFHTLFRSVPEGERLIDDYGCALQKEILLQGRVYISEHHLCFNANIFGWITNLVIAFTDIVDIEKRSTALVIPNAILISTCSSKHFVASFLSRDHAYDQMVEIWKSSRANNNLSAQVHQKIDELYSSEEDDSDYTSDEYTEDDEEYDDDEQGQHQRQPVMINSIEDRQGSLASLPLPKHLLGSEESRRRAISEAGPRPDMQELVHNKKEKNIPSSQQGSSPQDTDASAAMTTTSSRENNDQSSMPVQQIKEKTDCDCGKNQQHFPTVVMDNTYDSNLETMYNLLFNCSFMERFLRDVEKSTEICIGQWSESEKEESVYSRESSYIKYLGGSIGPKSTKCHLEEEVLHLDVTDYISQLTVTRTPDVPSGGSFTVKTRTCLSWCGQGQVRVLVTVLVDFTKSSWLRSTIEKASIDGQQNFYKSLDAALRKYLAENKSNTGPTGKKKRKNKHRSNRNRNAGENDEAAVRAQETAKESRHFLVEALLRLLNWTIENIMNPPSISQLTVFCMAIMVLTNIYIASKMAGVDQQLNLLSKRPLSPTGDAQEFKYQHHSNNNEDLSLWKLLSKLDPDARPEDLSFVRQQNKPVMRNRPAVENEREKAVYDDQLEFSQMAKLKLDKQMMEIEKMIQKAGQSMEQVTNGVVSQRQRILNPDWK